MKPLKLKMNAFGSYADETALDFFQLGGNGLYLITGETGSGKTTIFDAISYALFGKASGNARGNYRMLRSDYAEGRTKTFVELDFLSGGEIYRIRREIIPHFARKTEEVSYTDNVTLVLPDGTVLDRGREIDAKIIEIVGLDREQFAQIVMIAQNDFLRFLQSGTDERIKILRRIFNTSTLKHFQEGLKIRTRAKEDDRKAIVRDFEKYGVDHNNTGQQFAQWEQDIAADREAILRDDQKLQETDKAKEGLAAKIAVAEGLCKIFEELTLHGLALKEHTAKADEMVVLAQRKERGEIALHKIKPLADKYTDAEAAYTKAHTDFEASKSDVEAAALGVQQTEKLIAGLPPLENTQTTFDALKQEWQESCAKLSELTELNSNVKTITEKQTLLDTAKANLAETEAFIQSLPPIDTTKEALEKLVRALEQEGEKLKALTALQDEYQIIIEKQQVLSALQEEFDTLRETISVLPPLDEARQRFEQISSDAEKATEKLSLLTALQSNQHVIAEKQGLLAIEQAELMRLNSTYSHAKDKYDTLHEQFILGQAGLLAVTLREGEPCPVCGSIDHPAPAQEPSEEISGDKLKKLFADSDTAKDKVSRKSSECAALISEIDLLTTQFNIAIAAHIPNGSYKNAGELFAKEIAEAKERSHKLAEKKRENELFLNNLVVQIETTAKRQAELSPKCAALLSEVVTRKDKLVKEFAPFLPNVLWEDVGAELSGLLYDTQTMVEEMTIKKRADDAAFAQLKENWEISISKQKEWHATCVELTAAVSTLTDRFLKDLAKYIPGVIWENARTELSALFLQAQKSTAELTTKKDADELSLTELKAQWDKAKKIKAECSTNLAQASARIDERKKHEQDCLSQREEAQRLFVFALSANDFEDEAAYASAIISEDTLAEMAKQLASYDESGRRIRQDIARLEKDTLDKEKPDLEKLKNDFEALRSTSDTLFSERDEKKLRLGNKQRILNELRQSNDSLVRIEREYAAVKSLSDAANGKLDFETYAQMAYFERVLQAANLRLKVMSQNRYILLRKEESDDGRKRMGLDIEVADSYTGKSRSANSLSGGESFMASLSLALGLSDVVQQSAGGIHLGAMFIDEGFGSLDAEVLELSVRTLSNMADGNRIIGIISHVAELRERIEKQVCVEKTHSGSRIRLIV